MDTIIEEPDQLLRYRECLAILGISQSTLNRLVASGEIKVVHVSARSRRIKRSELTRYVAALGTTARGGVL